MLQNSGEAPAGQGPTNLKPRGALQTWQRQVLAERPAEQTV